MLEPLEADKNLYRVSYIDGTVRYVRASREEAARDGAAAIHPLRYQGIDTVSLWNPYELSE